MDDELQGLKEDLENKLTRLLLMQAQPALVVTERFDQVRHEIDLEAETRLERLSESTSDSDSDKDSIRIPNRLDSDNDSDSDDDDSDKDSIRIPNRLDSDNDSDSDDDDSDKDSIRIPNRLDSGDDSDSDDTDNLLSLKLPELRGKMIEFLKSKEDKILEKYAENQIRDLKDFSALKEKVASFTSRSSEGSSFQEFEDKYIELAMEITDETRRLESEIFSNQTFFYLKPRYTWSFGQIVHLLDQNFSEEDIELIKSRIKPDFREELITFHEESEMRLNNTLVIGQCRPFMITERLLCMATLVKSLSCLQMLDYNMISFNTRKDICLAYKLRRGKAQAQPIRNPYANIVSDAFQLYVYAQENDLDIALFTDFPDVKSFRLAGLCIKSIGDDMWPIIMRTDKLDLSDNYLDSINQEKFTDCEHIQELVLSSWCSPDTTFSLEFLRNFRSLKSLTITVSDGKVVLDPLRNLRRLQTLHLEGAAKIDLNKNFLEVTKEAIEDHLSENDLEELALSYFDIETFDLDVLKSSEIVTIQLSRVANIEEDFFRKLECHEFFIRKHAAILSIKLVRSIILPQISFQELIRLDLRNQDISDLPTGAFDQLVALELISLDGNRIRSIKCGVFDKLQSLIKLSLVDNPIENIDDYSFQNQHRLIHLDLSGCRLTKISDLTFVGLKNLSELILKSNLIETITVQSVELNSASMTKEELDLVRDNLFCDLNQLANLDLSKNKLTKFDINWLLNLHKLESLNLSDNNIDDVSGNCDQETLSALRLVDLSRNRLRCIDAEALYQLTSLQVLDLQNNRLERVERVSLMPLFRLNYFNVDNNPELEIVFDRDILGNGGSIKESLNLFNTRASFKGDALQGHKIKRLALSLDSAITLPVELQLLDLTGSKSQALELLLSMEENQTSFCTVDTLVMNNSSLETLQSLELGNRFSALCRLNLRNNQIKKLEAVWLENLTSLQELDLSGNQIESLDDPDLFHDSPYLWKLALRGNGLKQIHRRLLSCLINLLVLDLSMNPALENLDLGILRGLVRLDSINLASNNMKSFNLQRLIEFCPCLTAVDLSQNQLDHQSINEVTMSQYYRLESLKLADNLLENMDFVRDLWSLVTLDLSNNAIKSLESNGSNLLGRLTRLQDVNLSGNQIKSVCLDVFEKREDTRIKVDVTNNPLDSDDVIKDLELLHQGKLYSYLEMEGPYGKMTIVFHPQVKK